MQKYTEWRVDAIGWSQEKVYAWAMEDSKCFLLSPFQTLSHITSKQKQEAKEIT